MHPRAKSSITRPILLGFGLLIALYALHGLYLFQSMKTLSDLARIIHDHPLVVSNAALKASTLIFKIHLKMKDLTAAGSPGDVDAVQAEVATLNTEALDQLDTVRRNILGDTGAALISETISLFRAWEPSRTRFFELIRQGDLDNADRIVQAQGKEQLAMLEDKIAGLSQYARSKAQGFVAQSRQLNQQVSSGSFFLLLLWIALSAAIAFFTLRRGQDIEAALAEEKERVSVTLRSIGDGVIATDENGQVVLMNRVAEKLTGWTEAEAAGTSIEQVFTIVNEHTRKPCDNPVAMVLSARRIIGLANHTLLIARDGRERAIADSGAPIRQPDGGVIGVVLVFRDQTEERGYQKRIRESERKYRLLSDNTVDVIWTMNFDLVFTYVNPAIEPLTGFSPREWIGSRLTEHCDEENFERMAAIVASEMARGPESGGIYFEATMLKKNREPFAVEIRGRVIYDDDAQPLRIQGVTRDITQRKADEAVRRYQDKMLREMGRLAKIGAWEFDPATGKGTWTDEVARIHDLSPFEETSLVRGLGFYSDASRQRIEAAIDEAVRSGTPYDLELELTSAKGTPKWVRTIGRPKLQDGRVVQLRGSFQDITERKRFVQRIEHLNRVLRAIRDINQLVVREKDPQTLIAEGCRILVDNRGYASALIILCDDQDTPVAWANAGFSTCEGSIDAALGAGDLPPCCQRSLHDPVVISVAERATRCSNCRAVDDVSEKSSLCVGLIHQTARYGYLVVSLSTELRVDDEERRLLGEIAGDFAFALHALQLDENHKRSEDQRKTLERQLIQAQKMESIGRLAGGVAHDYNNMLSVIIGYSEMAMDKASADPALSADLKEILTAANRSAEITRQLLAFARQQTAAPRVLDLNDSVSRVLNMLRRLIGEDIDLVWLPKAGLWPVRIDPVQVDQLLANLCVNARDAIGGIGKVTIGTQNVQFDAAYCDTHAGFVPGDFVQLAVSDDGRGMDRQTMEKMFEPFFTTKGIGKGTGLGLATVYGIVKQNDGFVNVYSEPGKGTTIRTYLPRDVGVTTGAGVEQADSAPTGSGEVVLLVEDDSSILQLGIKLLTASGYTVLGAASPGQAEALAQEYAGQIRLLVTDVVMPEMNGRVLAERLRGRHPGLNVLFMSGYPADVIAHQGILDAGVDFIQKPFSRADLAKRVYRALGLESTDE